MMVIRDGGALCHQAENFNWVVIEGRLSRPPFREGKLLARTNLRPQVTGGDPA
jgi:hypothetical protein